MSYQTVFEGVTPFMRGKYERDARKYWTSFYERNGVRFYKDRHWLNAGASDGFPCLTAAGVRLLEAGCGAANAAFPLLADNATLRVYAFDFARSAVDLVRAAPAYDPARVTAFVWDFAREELDDVPAQERAGLPPEGGVDFVTCLFVLSAVPPELHVAAMRRLGRALRVGGRVLFRDYCVDDLAAGRFKKTSCIEEGYYVRQDGTLSYFFDEGRLDGIMTAAGLVRRESKRVHRTVVNRKEGKEMNRVWLQAEYERKAA